MTRTDVPAAIVPVGFVVTWAIVPRVEVTMLVLEPLYDVPLEVTVAEISPTAPYPEDWTYVAPD
jgi:hypothetical protein